MLRMEIALWLILLFIAIIYFLEGYRRTPLHKAFSKLLTVTLINLTFDALTVYTVNHLETVPPLLNEWLHRLFIGSMIFLVYLFYRYIAVLTANERIVIKFYDIIAKVYLVIAELGALVLPVHYAITPDGNYSDGIHVAVCYVSVAFYVLLCMGLLLRSWKNIYMKKKKLAITLALAFETIVATLQAFNPTWLISGMGLTLMTLSFYLTLENPAVIRAELIEQKMSMLYLKSQVNPHFLYNTLDAIRIQAQLNNDNKVAELIMRLVDFFRLSVKVDRQMVALEDELNLLEAYMDLICYRYPEISCQYDIDPDLLDALVPNFILQPIVENSVLHGLKNKGYRGSITVTAKKAEKPGFIAIQIADSGGGFNNKDWEYVNDIINNYNKKATRFEGDSVGILNVQKRIKFLYGRECGLSYTENPEGGVTAHFLLNLEREEKTK